MLKNILVPLDGGKQSEQALAVAGAIAKSNAAHISLLHVIEDSAIVFANPAGLPVREGVGDKLLHGEFARAEEYLAGAADKLRTMGLSNVEALTLRGVGYRVISDVARGGYDLVVMTTYGRTVHGAAPLGSVATQVLRNSDIAVLLISNGPAGFDEASLPMRRILVPLDGSACAEQALPIAVSLAKMADATLALLGVTPPETHYSNKVVQQAVGNGSVMVEIVSLGAAAAEATIVRHASNDYRYLSNVARQYIPQGMTYGIVEASNEPLPSILGNTQRMNCDLVVMTAHGNSGCTGLLSRLSEEIIAASNVPVLLLRSEPA